MTNKFILGLTLLAVGLTAGGGVIYNNNLVQQTKTTQTQIEKELKDIEDLKNKRQKTVEDIKQLNLNLKEAELNHALVTNSDPRINPALMTQHTKTIDETLNTLFTWTNGAEYDAARTYLLEKTQTENDFTTKYFKENTKIEVPEEYDIPDNEVDLNKIKSKLRNYHTTVTQLGEQITYETLVEFQIYEDSKELDREEPIVEKVNLTITLNSDGSIERIDGFDLYEP